MIMTRTPVRFVAGLLAMGLVAALVAVGTAESASAAPTPGAKCKKVGKITSNGLICKRKNGKKVFVRIPASSSSTSTPSGTAAPAPEAPTSPEFTAAEKEIIKKAFADALTGKQVDRTFSDANSLTQLIWHLCPGNRYGLVSNLSFTGSGSTTSTEVGSWTIADAGGIRNLVEGVVLQMTPADPSISPYTLEIAAFADGRLEANGRRAVVSPSGEC